jgi:hypothetical protein
MRLYPAAGAASFRSNKTDKDIVLGRGKLVVPPGVVMHMPITTVHHSEGTWEKAYDFVPERFLEVRCHCTRPSRCTECPLMLWCQSIPTMRPVVVLHCGQAHAWHLSKQPLMVCLHWLLQHHGQAGG